MKISNKIVSKFQEGGMAPAPAEQQGAAPAAAPGADQGGQDPVMQLAQLAQQALTSQDCQAALAVCEGFMSLIQGAQGGGAQAQPAPGEGAPVYKKGGKLLKRVKA